MIIVAIIALSLVVLTAVYATFVGLPSLPATVIDAYAVIIGYVSQGASFVKYLLGTSIVNSLFRITLAYEVVKMGYKFVMWVAKKIPMFGVSD